jgi:hypothetical protein
MGRVTYRTTSEVETDTGGSDRTIYEESYPDERCKKCERCIINPESGFGSIGSDNDGKNKRSETRNSYYCVLDTTPDNAKCVKYGPDVRLALIEERLKNLEGTRHYHG